MLYTYKPSTTSTMSKNQKKRKQRGNKAKQVTSWDDMCDVESSNTKSTQKAQGHWVPGTIPQSVIKKMPWGDLDELTDEEFGYWRVSES